MTTKTTKTILFASLLVAMILPFSAMNMADAAPNENANDIAKNKVEENTPENWKKHADKGEIILPGGNGWIHPSELKFLNSEKSINENAKNGIDKKFMMEIDGKTVMNLDAIEKHSKNLSSNLDEEINYPNTSYNQVAVKSGSMTYFNGFWNVPDSPASFSGGTIYTFDAMQPFSGVIFQPILQYGNNGVCGNLGDNWAMAPVVYSPYFVTIGDCMPVSEGDFIRGTISKSGSTWTIAVQDYNTGASDSVQVGYGGTADDSLVALETYGLANLCSSISGDIDFRYMTISGSSVPNWVDQSPTGQQWCGMIVDIVNQSTVSLDNDN